MSAKKQIAVFLGIVFAVSYAIEAVIIRSGGMAENTPLIIALMWVPGIVGILCTRFFGRNSPTGAAVPSIRDTLGLRLPRSWKYLAYAYLLPAFAAMMVLGLLVLTGISKFGIDPELIEERGGVAGVLRMAFLVEATLGVLLGSLLAALGEELGWRGFLQSKMLKADIRRPYLWIGLIWSAWHLPMVLFSDYATSPIPALSSVLFTIAVLSFSMICSRWMAISGSILVPTLLHGAHNAWMQGIYPTFIEAGPLDPYFGGESGVFTAIVYTSLTLWIGRSKHWDKTVRKSLPGH